MNNFFQMIKAVKNPQEFVKNMARSNCNPIINNLVDMASKNDIEGIKEFGTNLFKQQGRDFNKELKEFMDSVK